MYFECNLLNVFGSCIPSFLAPSHNRYTEQPNAMAYPNCISYMHVFCFFLYLVHSVCIVCCLLYFIPCISSAQPLGIRIGRAHPGFVLIPTSKQLTYRSHLLNQFLESPFLCTFCTLHLFAISYLLATLVALHTLPPSVVKSVGGWVVFLN